MNAAKSILLSLFVALLFVRCQEKPSNKNLESNFKNPPNSSRPLTWWHWIHGHVTKDGITKDLEAMKNAGIGGSILFNVAFYPEGDVHFYSDKWWDHVEHAIKESDRLGLKFGAFNCEGWSMSGGPWITPEESMKQMVWEDTVIEGGGEVTFKLPQPHFNHFYKDVAVLALPSLPGAEPLEIKEVAATENVKQASFAFDKNLETKATFEGDTSSITFDLGEVREIRRMEFQELFWPRKIVAYASLSYSIDGQQYLEIPHQLPLGITALSTSLRTLAFSKIDARYVKLLFTTTENNKGLKLPEVNFYSTPGINFWSGKGAHGYRTKHDYKLAVQKELASGSSEVLPESMKVAKNDLIQLTDQMDRNGMLTWNAPEGKWKILRVGYTSTNRKNHPVSRYGEGLESDKMSKAATEKHFEAFLGKLIQKSIETIGKPIDFAQLDSWEANIQDWTKDLESEFEKRRGYSIIPWLPVLAGGEVVSSIEESNRFLWDFRATLAELVTENYWGVFRELCEKYNVTLLGEGSGNQHFLYDPIMYQQQAHVPMGEFWSSNGYVRVDNKNAASVAHTYGIELAGSEAFTNSGPTMWSITPFKLKRLGDEAFTLGINQFILHTYVHQPYDWAPGFTLKRWGNHFQRLNTWYNHAQGWTNYIARSQYLLRQGAAVSDVCYFTGEGIPGYLGLRHELNPSLPEGYDYDGVNLDLLQVMKVMDGKLVLPSGASYYVLVFRETANITSDLAKEIKRLVSEGGTVIAAKPTGSLSLVDYPNNADMVSEIANEVWSDVDGISVKQNNFGKGKVIWGKSLDEVLNGLNLVPDFQYSTNVQGAEIQYIHRKDENADIYFIANRENKTIQANMKFRINGKVPELWDQDKGTIMAVDNFTISNGVTELPMQMDPLGSVFVFFKNQSTADQTYSIENPETASCVMNLHSPWKLTFNSFYDIPNDMEMEELRDWTEVEELKYFSGSADYTNTFEITTENVRKVILDLGEVKDIAEVSINGKEIANLWKPPYRLDITEAVKKGSNQLLVTVTNTTVNRLVGDEQFPIDIDYEKEKRTGKWMLASVPDWYPYPEKRNSDRQSFVTFQYLDQDSELESSGLMGPVKVVIYK